MKVQALMLSLLLTCSAYASEKEKETVTVTPVEQDADAANGGVIYSLPQTVVRIKLTARVVISTAGPYFKYSTRYLNLTDVVTANSVKWELLGAEVSTIGKADYSRRYKLTASSAEAMPSVAFTEDGVVAGFNVEAIKKTEDPAVTPTPDLSYANFERVQLSQSVLSRTSTASMAEECANSIYNFRSMRVNLLSGTKEAQLPDAGSYDKVLAEIDKQERAHTELFAGHRDTVMVIRYVDVVPDESGAGNIVPVRFSDTDGFVDAMDLMGKPVYVDFVFDNETHVNAYADGSKQRAKSPIEGLRYIIPGNLTVRVLDRNIQLVQTTVQCSQNGQVATLPADYLMSHKILIDPATGNITSLQPK